MYAENDDALEYGISQITILIGRTVSEHVSLPIYIYTLPIILKLMLCSYYSTPVTISLTVMYILKKWKILISHSSFVDVHRKTAMELSRLAIYT